MKNKITISIIMILLFSFTTISYGDVPLNEMSITDWKTDTPYGQFTVDEATNVYLNNKFKVNLASSHSGELYPKRLIETLYLTDMVYFSSRESVFFTGLVIDNKMDQEIYGDNMTMLVGTPYVVIMEYKIKESKLSFQFILEGFDIYGYPYNADNFYDSANDEDYKEIYHWYNEYVNPKFGKSKESNKLWFISKFKWPYGDLKSRQDYLLIFDIKTTNEVLKLNHQMYLLENSFKNLVSKGFCSENYTKEYKYMNNAIFVQEHPENQDVVQIISMTNDNIGLAFEYDLSQYRFPKFIKAYYK